VEFCCVDWPHYGLSWGQGPLTPGLADVLLCVLTTFSYTVDQPIVTWDKLTQSRGGKNITVTIGPPRNLPGKQIWGLIVWQMECHMVATWQRRKCLSGRTWGLDCHIVEIGGGLMIKAPFQRLCACFLVEDKPEQNHTKNIAKWCITTSVSYPLYLL
jgi:hypothetical protein